MNTVDSGTGEDFIYGSNDIDRIVGRSRPGETLSVRAGGHDDVVVGGLGTDRLFGGPGNDWVIAEPADVQPLNDGDNDTIPNVDDGFGPTWSAVLLPSARHDTEREAARWRRRP